MEKMFQRTLLGCLLVFGGLFVIKTGNLLESEEDVAPVDFEQLVNIEETEPAVDDDFVGIGVTEEIAEEEDSDDEGDELFDQNREPAAGVNAFSRGIRSRRGWRIHPILRYLKWHNGNDWIARCGVPIPSREAGVITHAGWLGSSGRCRPGKKCGYGNTVVIRSGNCSALYAHMSSVAVRVGQQVNVGAYLGAVGGTGFATGCHLHHEPMCAARHRGSATARVAARQPRRRNYPRVYPRAQRQYVQPQAVPQNDRYWIDLHRDQRDSAQ